MLNNNEKRRIDVKSMNRLDHLKLEIDVLCTEPYPPEGEGGARRAGMAAARTPPAMLSDDALRVGRTLPEVGEIADVG